MTTKEKVATVLVGIWAVTLLCMIIWENHSCGDRGILQDIVCKSPDNQRAHLNLGISYRQHGLIPDAVHEFETVRKLAKKNGAKISSGVSFEDSAISNEASILMDVGDYPNARTL